MLCIVCRVPIRADAASAGAWVPVPGWTPDHEWEVPACRLSPFGQRCRHNHCRLTAPFVRPQRLIPPNELPALRNPSVGYAVTCNQKITTDDYPYVISQHYGMGCLNSQVCWTKWW